MCCAYHGCEMMASHYIIVVGVHSAEECLVSVLICNVNCDWTLAAKHRPRVTAITWRLSVCRSCPAVLFRRRSCSSTTCHLCMTDVDVYRRKGFNCVV